MLDEQDHRALGQQLDLFHLQEEAPGMVFWHPRGFLIYRLLEQAIRRQLQKDNYQEVRTPQLLRRPIWEASGHWQNFACDMFVFDQEEPGAAIKPVSCPGHLEMVRRMSLSYRDLPLRMAEFGLCHRNEPSGTLHGLFRLRQFTQDDGHIFCTPEHVPSEVSRFCQSLERFYKALGFSEIALAFSTRPEQRAGSDSQWDRAERLLEDAAKSLQTPYELQPGQGAFYGPKLEFALRDRVGRSWQCGTIQLDLVLPERFDVAYIDAQGQKQRPVMLHRALMGSLERFLGVLLEHYSGALPAWLSPEQVVVAPVSEGQREASEKLVQRMNEKGLRALLDGRSETLSRRVLDAHARRIPYFVTVGPREVQNQSMSVRDRERQWSGSWEQGIEALVKGCEAPL